MADVKISALPAASTPLTGAEVLPIVQSSVTTKVAVSNLTAGLSGTASININGTVGATTPTTGAFTSGTFSTTLVASGLLTVNTNGSTLPAVVGTESVRTAGANGSTNRMLLDGFGGVSAITFRRANTSSAAPSAVQSGDNLAFFSVYGYGATAYNGNISASLFSSATENWTDSAIGSKWTIQATANGGTTRSTIAEFSSGATALTGTLVVNGNVTLGDAVGDVHTTNGLVQIGQGTFAARTGVKGVIAAGSDLGSIHCQLGDSGGTWQWINAANSLGVMILDNAGALSVTGTLGVGGYSAYVCRAWVNFNGTGTVAINGSQNVSSITDNGTGDYTVNFTVSMANALYTAVGSCSAQANSYAAFVTMNRNNGGAYVAPTAAAQRLNTLDHQSYAAADNQNVSVAIII